MNKQTAYIPTSVDTPPIVSEFYNVFMDSENQLGEVLSYDCQTNHWHDSLGYRAKPVSWLKKVEDVYVLTEEEMFASNVLKVTNNASLPNT